MWTLWIDDWFSACDQTRMAMCAQMRILTINVTMGYLWDSHQITHIRGLYMCAHAQQISSNKNTILQQNCIITKSLATYVYYHGKLISNKETLVTVTVGP